MLKTAKLATKLLWRELRAGEWTIVCFALLLAITAITSVHFYTDRLTQGLEKQSARFLGGDLVVRSSNAIPVDWIEKARQLNLRTAEVWSYPSVVTANNQLQLVNLQAVSAEYPLIGGNVIHLEKDEIWVEERLLPLLKANLNDFVTIGSKQFKLQKLLTSDIDSLNTGWVIAPRAMMRIEDVAATGTVVPGSRVDYRLLLAGERGQLQEYKRWIKPRLLPGQTLIEVTNERFVLRDVVQRTQDYLQLILLLCVMLSGVAIALSMQQYLKRHYSHVALWRCLGAKQKDIVLIFIIQLLIIAIVIGAVSICIGYFAQSIFAYTFKSYISFTLPPASTEPFLFGSLVSVILLFAFSYPLISELPKTSPLSIWRGEFTILELHKDLSVIISFLIITMMIAWFTNFSFLTLYFLTGVLFSVALLYGLSVILLDMLRLLVAKVDGTIRNGIAQIIHHGQTFSLQFISFNLILIALIISAFVKSSLIDNWQKTLLKTAPNYFAINIARNDIIPLQKFFKERNISVEGIYPMVRGRIISLNGQAILYAVPSSSINNNALHRDLNLSAMWVYPSDNKIVKGNAWTLRDAGKYIVSVENNLAKDLNIQIDDKLTFQVGEKQFTTKVVNLRSVSWSSIHPNFFMIFPPGILDVYPATYITSFHLPPKNKLILNDIVKLFPNITIIDMADLLLQMQTLLNHIITSVQYLFAFALAIGVLIFVVSVQASLDERKQAYYLLRVLGADRQYLIKSIITEFICFVVIISLTSIFLSWVIAGLLNMYIFKL